MRKNHRRKRERLDILNIDAKVQHDREHDPEAFGRLGVGGETKRFFLRSVYNKAEEAFNNKKPRSSCPYKKRSDLRMQWLGVWDLLFKKETDRIRRSMRDISRAESETPECNSEVWNFQVRTIESLEKELEKLQKLKDC